MEQIWPVENDIFNDFLDVWVSSRLNYQGNLLYFEHERPEGLGDKPSRISRTRNNWSITG